MYVIHVIVRPDTGLRPVDWCRIYMSVLYIYHLVQNKWYLMDQKTMQIACFAA